MPLSLLHLPLYGIADSATKCLLFYESKHFFLYVIFFRAKWNKNAIHIYIRLFLVAHVCIIPM